MSLTHGSNQTLVFDLLDTNRGKAYHTDTGHFVAPSAGVYTFTLDLVSVPGTLATATIVHNFELIHTVWASGRQTGDMGMASGTVIRTMKPRDTVYVVLFRHIGYAYVDDSMTRFSGHMI